MAFRSAMADGKTSVEFPFTFWSAAAESVNDVLFDDGIQNVHHVGKGNYIIEYLPDDFRRSDGRSTIK
jgi:hypothetical protein